MGYYTDEEQKELFLKERDKNPEAFAILQDIVAEKSNILYKSKKKDEFIEIPYDDIFSEQKVENYDRVAWDLDIRMNNGEPRLVVIVIDYKDIEYLEEHMPCLNYFPDVLLLEDYGVKWKKKEEEN